MAKDLKNVKCFLLDMDGTFYLGENILPGSLDFIEAVKASGRDLFHQRSSHNADYYVAPERMGLRCRKDPDQRAGHRHKPNELYPASGFASVIFDELTEAA